MLKVGGFSELKPEQKIIEEQIFDIVKKNYRQFGYTPIETPGVERNEVLTAKGGGEVGNQILGVYGLAQGATDLKKYSLHFDLTIPFARYVLDYKAELTFPFKRSQIQKVWRGERQQRGRSREFYQADIDVIWEESETKDYLFYDSEVINIGYKTYLEIFEKFNLDLKIKININNKKIISGFIGALGLGEKFTEISIVIDNKEKISSEEFGGKN
ncbi:MAG: ATP phosphoribosyltransferase regulatory subunit [Candidatus Gracilibacteria bacterium]|nr:ATP phosphoribosyltransferase regulatory subunit [Candidatus Gracilibacteria bacterium]